ncbi:MAG TPA: hypothetical protein DDZ42_16205 [Candidatus Rokubacteria bacterium]|nr:MAG: hypothetical protein A2050_15525 [Candidatus Rokubacteria bacterium GWA2_73_35]HBH03436.1 hypothetical protein [Candidatus Rokubacteria bacterium]
MEFHHVLEAAGVIVLGLVFYSYSSRWFASRQRLAPAWAHAVHGLAFGALAVVLMIARIQVAEGVFFDARTVPVALIALVEGWPAGLVAGLVAVAYRVWLGGSGAPAGVVGLLGTVLAGALVHAWARRHGQVAARHAFGLAVLVYAVTFGSFLLLGARGLAMWRPLALPLLVMSLVGVGLAALLFRDVVESRAAEAARRDAAELRAVTLLARAAAHEINNPLMIVTSGLSVLAKRLPAGTEEAQWAERAREGVGRIKDIVGRMNEITRVEEVPPRGSLPPMLDIRKSSDGR